MLDDSHRSLRLSQCNGDVSMREVLQEPQSDDQLLFRLKLRDCSSQPLLIKGDFGSLFRIEVRGRCHLIGMLVVLELQPVVPVEAHYQIVGDGKEPGGERGACRPIPAYRSPGLEEYLLREIFCVLCPPKPVEEVAIHPVVISIVELRKRRTISSDREGDERLFALLDIQGAGHPASVQLSNAPAKPGVTGRSARGYGYFSR